MEPVEEEEEETDLPRGDPMVLLLDMIVMPSWMPCWLKCIP